MTTSRQSHPVEYSVVVPVYRGQDALRPLTEQLRSFFSAAGYRYEIVFVDDCGPDASWPVITALRQELGPPVVKAIRLTRNFGQHNALLCGFRYAAGRFIITMDEDLQHRPQDIARLITAQFAGDYDVVYGKYARPRHAGFRNLTSRLFKKILRLAIPALHPDYTAFRLLKATIAQQCEALHTSSSSAFLDGYLARLTRSVTSVVVAHQPRQAGQSAYTIKKLLAHAVAICVTFSAFPFRVFAATALFILLATTCYLGGIATQNMQSGITFLNSAALSLLLGFGGGLLLLSGSILSEYTRRANRSATRRPRFAVAEVQL